MASAARGLARFADDLPKVDPHICMGEGDTPAVSLERLAAQLGIGRVTAKLESMNPTGSYKDRVASMSLSLAVSRGCAGWIATSSGNAGMSMAAYGARANLPGFLCLTSTAPLQKKLPLVPFGTRLAAVEGIGDGGAGMVAARLMEEVRRAASRHDLFLAITAHAFNADGMRGIDTIGYELSEQAPDATHVYVPTGGGGLLASIGRGMAGRNLRAKLVACQPSGCAPIARQLSGELDTPAIESCDSRISALQLPQPPDGVLAVEAVRRTSGWGTHVTDESILTAQQRLATAEGVFAEPASATALACLAEDVERGRIGRDDHAVLVVTGAGWKDLSRFESAVRSLAPVPLDGAVEAIDAWALSAVTSRR